MHPTRRAFTLSTAVLASIPLQACTSPPLPPQAIQHRQGRKPVDSAREFIEMRQRAMNGVLDGFARYRRAVIDRNQNIANGEIVWANQVMEIENGHPAPKALRDFIESPEGAYLSAQDKEYLDRLDTQYRRQLQARYDTMAEDEDAKKLPSSWSNGELIVIYSRLESARKFCGDLDRDAVGGIVKGVLSALAEPDRSVLVRAHKEHRTSGVESLRTAEQVTRWLAVLRYVQGLLDFHRRGFSQRPAPERRLLELVVNQSLFFSPFFYDNAAVEVTRFNDFAELERRKLDQLVRDEIRKLA